MLLSERHITSGERGELTDLLSLSPKIALVDDDPLYGKAFLRAAEIKGIPCDYYSSPTAFYSHLDGAFEIALLDYDLGSVTGVQVSRVMELITPNKFVVLASGYRAIRSWENDHSFLKGFVNKNSPPLQQLEEVLGLWARRVDARRRR